MKILIVGNIKPSPVRMGNQTFLIKHIKMLRKAGHSVEYLYIDDDIREGKRSLRFDNKEISDVNVEVYKIPLPYNMEIKLRRKYNDRFHRGRCGTDDYYPRGLARHINQLQITKQYDACIVNYFYLSKALMKIRIPIRGLYTHDSFINRNVRNDATTLSLTQEAEGKALRRAPIVFALQSEEAELFKRLAPESTVKTIFMPLELKKSELKRNHVVLFFAGNASFNVEGIKWWTENVWGRIKSRFPDAELIIGGGIFQSLKSEALPEGVMTTGYVDNLQEFYDRGDIAINPVYHGSGLKIKTIEGIEYNKVVITTPHSAEGIYNISEAPIAVAKNPEEWVKIISSLWKDDEYMEELHRRAEGYVRAINAYIEEEYRSVLG